MMKHISGAILLFALLAGCRGEDQPKPGDMPRYAGVGEGETITAVGNEPFWQARIEGSSLTWSTPENIEGETIAVTRFAGNGGLGFSGRLDGEALQLALTPGSCDDTMSERSYPFTVTVTLGTRLLEGCGYSGSKPYSGPDES